MNKSIRLISFLLFWLPSLVHSTPGELETNFANQGVLHTPSGDLVRGLERLNNDAVLIGGIGSNSAIVRFSKVLK